MSIFTKVKVKKPRRSNFDLSYDVKTTTEFGRLTPIMLQEVMPGDTFKLSSQIFCRMAPMIAPIMSRIDVYTHFFFVPMRILWDKWEDFITGGEDGLQAPIIPRIQLLAMKAQNLLGTNSLASYLGLPIEGGVTSSVSLLPFKAYQQIYNDWYRDQNLEDPIDIDKSVTIGSSTFINDKLRQILTIRNRAWQKDYFTSALPWAQRGPQVELPISEDGDLQVRFKSQGTVLSGNHNISWPTGGNQYQSHLDINEEGGTNPMTAYIDALHNPTINELRRSIRVQEWLEKSARGGARYIEQILSHFGVKSSDSRLQRAELLGGGKSPIMISDIEQTSSSDATSPQGNLAGKGVTAQVTHGFQRFFEEHGFVIGIMSIMPKASYQQGIQRLWSRQDKFDYAWPEFANLGEQEILNKELYVSQGSNPNGVFGYAPRYSEYKYNSGLVTGEFRNTLTYWHTGRIFTEEPKLNNKFIKPDVDSLNRIFAYPGDEDGGYNDHFWVQVYHNLQAKRPLPYYGIPTI